MRRTSGPNFYLDRSESLSVPSPPKCTRVAKNKTFRRTESCSSDIVHKVSLRNQGTAPMCVKKRLSKSKSSPGFKNLPVGCEKQCPPLVKNAWGEDSRLLNSGKGVNVKLKLFEIESTDSLDCSVKVTTPHQNFREKRLHGNHVIKLSVSPKPRSRTSELTKDNVYFQSLKSRDEEGGQGKKIISVEPTCDHDNNINKNLTLESETNYFKNSLALINRDESANCEHSTSEPNIPQTNDHQVKNKVEKSLSEDFGNIVHAPYTTSDSSAKASNTHLDLREVKSNENIPALPKDNIPKSESKVNCATPPKDDPHSTSPLFENHNSSLSIPLEKNSEENVNICSNFTSQSPLILSCQDTQKRTLRKQFRFTGYRPHGRNQFVPFKTMFTKPTVLEFNRFQSNDERISNSDKIVAKVSALPINDQEKIESTRKILKEKLQRQSVKNSKGNKIPLSIFIEPKHEHSCDENDFHEDTVEDSDSDEVFHTSRPPPSPVTSDFTRKNGTVKDSNNSVLHRASIVSKISKRKPTPEISTQVSLASPVHSDVETLPPDILETTRQKLQHLHVSDDEIDDGGPKTCTELKIATKEANGQQMLPKASCEVKSFPVLVTRSRANSRRSSAVEGALHWTDAELALRSDGMHHNKPPPRRKIKKYHQSSPEIYLPDEGCFAGVQEALKLQAKLAATNVPVDTGTLLRGLLTPPQYRQLEACPVLRLYAGC